MSEIYDDISKYELTVHDFAEQRVNFMFHNEGNEHALIICQNMFGNATREIRIAANKLYNDEVVNTPSYIESMKKFLDHQDATLKIIVSEPPRPKMVNLAKSLYEMLYYSDAYREGRVRIKDADGKSFRDPDNMHPVNFCTADGRMYRYEWNIQERCADANFNDIPRVEQLNRNFDRIFDTLQDLDLSAYFHANA